jgi:hypothetical protein
MGPAMVCVAEPVDGGGTGRWASRSLVGVGWRVWASLVW